MKRQSEYLTAMRLVATQGSRATHRYLDCSRDAFAWSSASRGQPQTVLLSDARNTEGEGSEDRMRNVLLVFFILEDTATRSGAEVRLVGQVGHWAVSERPALG